MLIPQDITLTGYRGATFNEQLNFWNDTAQTSAFDFSPWNVSVTVNPIGSGSPLTPGVTISGGSIFLSLNPSDTAAAGLNYHVVITLTAKVGSPAEVEYLAHGPLTFSDA